MTEAQAFEEWLATREAQHCFALGMSPATVQRLFQSVIQYREKIVEGGDKSKLLQA